MRKHFITFIAVAMLASPAWAGFIFSDPTDVQTASLNPNGRNIVDSGGNIALAAFNAISNKYVFNFDSTNSGTNDNAYNYDPGSLELTSPTFSAGVIEIGSGYGVRVTGRADAASGSAYVAFNQDARVTPGSGFTGVAFVIPKLVGSVNVKLFDVSDQPIGNASGWDLAAASLTEAVAFAYVGGSTGSDIRRIEIDATTTSEWGLDDVSFTTAVPEPASLMLLAAGSVFLLRRKR